MKHPASIALTALLLGKECGVNVDEETLLGALRFFYRFAGHGTVAYGDHRGEGGPGSNGKDGMIAAYLKTGTNVLAAYGNVEYDQKTQAPCGQMDLAIEGLKKSDLK